MEARVFRQGTPNHSGTERDGKTPVYAANLQYVGNASGTAKEVWDKARKMVRHPVLEFR